VIGIIDCEVDDGDAGGIWWRRSAVEIKVKVRKQEGRGSARTRERPGSNKFLHFWNWKSIDARNIWI
jgi:hypothetical protein